MVFKKLKASLGLGGGATVETELNSVDVSPGESVSGVITVTAGDLEQKVSFLEIALQARVEVETDDSEYNANRVFHKLRVTDEFQINPGDAEQTFEFELDVPIETPFNVIGGYDLDKIDIGVRTELEIARAVDSTDVDPLRIHALPAHEEVIAAVERLGFQYSGADLEDGRIPGSQLPFYQEVEYSGSSRFSGIGQLEVTFITRDSETEVILEVDRKGGFLSSGGDSVGRFTVPTQGTSPLDAQVEAAINDLGRKRGLFG